jgi:hydroxymethylglutaryl-CoA synthase
MVRPVSSPPSAGDYPPAVGLSGLALYLPPYRVDLRAWCDWTGAEWSKVRDVVGDGFRLLGPAQSVYTMAAAAVLRLITAYGVDPQRIHYLGLGTESSTDNSAGAIIVKGIVETGLRSLGLPPIARGCEVPEFKHACLGGIYGLKNALRFLATDADDNACAIVVCADKALYERGSSGEPTQGAGAVAMLLERNPALATIDLRESGTASAYRLVDFRKPLTAKAPAGGPPPSIDIPVFNGRYSTSCYVDEVRRAMEAMYRRRRLVPADYIRNLAGVFMHRPYARMPETGWGLTYLFALAAGTPADHDELASYCAGAGLRFGDVLAEMTEPPDVASYGVAGRIQDEVFPLAMTVLKVFRQSEAFRRWVRAPMQSGSMAMREMGNLYTAALPAWLAAGFAEAAAAGPDLAGRELLAVGYGSGDAADAIPLRVVAGWEAAARRIDIAGALDGSIALTAEQYLALREGHSPRGLPPPARGEFVVDHIGQDTGLGFQDLGIEYYRYVE